MDTRFTDIRRLRGRTVRRYLRRSRSLSASRSFRGGGERALLSVRPGYGVRAVSYTHLDVYKRQVFPFERSAGMMKTLEQQNWFIRRALGQRIRNQLKNVPEIQFFLDDSLEYIEHIEQALK